MALPDSAKWVVGSTYVFAHGDDWAGGTVGWGTEDVEIDLSAITDALADQSVKVEIGDGSGNQDLELLVEASMETQADSVEGQTVDLYVGWSDDATPGTGNPAGLTGTAIPYTGGTAGLLPGGLKQLEYVGSLVMQAKAVADASPQVALVATIVPKGRYMMLVVVNNSGATTATTADECAIRFTERRLQVQDQS